MPADLWVPETARPEPKRLGWKCFICDEFFEGIKERDFFRHVRACERKAGPVAEEAVAVRDGNWFTGVADTEQMTWHRNRKGTDA